MMYQAILSPIQETALDQRGTERKRLRVLLVLHYVESRSR